MSTIIANAGGGNWSNAGTWSTGFVPTSADDVVFNASSGNVEIDVNASCRSLDCSGGGSSPYSGNLTHDAAVTLSVGTSTANGTLALRLVPGMAYILGSSTTSALAFVSTAATQVQITSAGQTFGNVTFNGPGGSWASADGFSNGSTATVAIVAGTVNTNGFPCSWGSLVASGSSVRSLTLGSSSITITGTSGTVWGTNPTANLTFNAGTSAVTITGAGTLTVDAGGISFYGLTFAGNAVLTGSVAVSSTINVNGTFAAIGNGPSYRLLVQASVLGVAQAINATNVALNNVDFQDIVGGGTATWGGTSVGNCLGNSGITFTAEADQTWTGSTGSWSNAANWTSRVPLPQDNVIISALASGTITADMPRLGASITVGAVGIATTGQLGTSSSTLGNVKLGSPGASSLATIIFTAPVTNTVYGSLTMAPGMTINLEENLTFSGRGSQTVTSAGAVWNGGIAVAAPGGTYTFLDALNNSTGHLYLTAGTLVATGNVSTLLYQPAAATTTTMGSGTWTLGGIGVVWNSSGTASVNAGTSTIVISDTSASGKIFSGQGKVFGNIALSGGSGSVTIAGGNTFYGMTIPAGATVLFSAGSTTTVSSFVAIGSPGNLISLFSTVTGSPWSISQASGVVSSDYLALQDSTATGGATFYAGSGSENINDNSGWFFVDAGGFALSVSDGTTLTDGSTVQLPGPLAVVDATTSTDTVLVQFPGPVGVADTNSENDVPTVRFPGPIAVTDGAAVATTAIVEFPGPISVADATTIIDVPSVTGALLPTILVGIGTSVFTATLGTPISEYGHLVRGAAPSSPERTTVRDSSFVVVSAGVIPRQFWDGYVEPVTIGTGSYYY